AARHWASPARLVGVATQTPTSSPTLPSKTQVTATMNANYDCSIKEPKWHAAVLWDESIELPAGKFMQQQPAVVIMEAFYLVIETLLTDLKAAGC
ncbi:hypothetical protein ACSJLP_24345, partial [Gordonia rhizosphera NBRC 16068]|uniref:hypothetical protein n=1 Tax=Gordonia rhizosphera TaxID=83341 RepID=UPI003EE10607